MPISLEDLSEQELRVISEALQAFIDANSETSSCDFCNTGDEDEDGAIKHTTDCPVATAKQLQEKVGIEVIS